MMKYGLLFAAVAALLLYLNFNEEGKQPASQTAVKVNAKQMQDEPKAVNKKRMHLSNDESVEEEKSKRAVDTEDSTSGKTVEPDYTDEESGEEIAEDERAEDYYGKNSVVHRKNLVGDADIKWIAPDKSEKTNGEFGRPPQVY